MGSSSLASPAFVVGFSFFLLSHLVIHSSHATHPECGSGTIYCEYGIHIINSTGGKPYEVKSFNETDNTIVIRDLQLSENLHKGNCSLLNFSTPNFPHLSLEVKTPILTLFKCKKYDVIPPEIPELLDHDYGENRECNEYVLFYGKLKRSPPLLPPVPNGCSVIHFPVHPPFDGGKWSAPPLLHLLEMGFSLKWSYTSECHDCETKCGRDWNEALKNCAETNHETNHTNHETNHGGKRLLASLGIGVGAFVGGILLPIIFFYCRRRRRNGRFFGSANSKNRSSSLTPLSGNTLDLEKGGSTYFRVPIFSYEELVDATNNFDSSKELGDGGFGIVYYGKLRDGREVAIKRLYENTFKRVEQFMNEVEILNRLRHQNLVTLYGCTSRHSRELLLVYEYIPNGTVADHLHGEIANAVSLRWPTRLSIAIETASALAYLHASDIIHRDVKTNNILLDNNFRVKVADFGLSRLFPLDVTHVSTTPQGTPGYVDPEYRRCYQLTEKSDVYSFGVVLIELISSLPAVDINRHRQEINLANLAMNKIQSGALHELIDPCLGFEADYGVRMMTTLVAELAFRCLQLDREMRPSMDEVLEVLKGIESEDYKMEKEEVVGIPAEEVGMLKSIQPPISQA